MGAQDTDLESGLARVMQRAGSGPPSQLERLTGGATMESWRFSSGGELYVLRRAPTLEFLAERPFGHDTEAAIIRSAKAAGVRAPDIVAELEPEDGIGSGFIMKAIAGTPSPKAILAVEDPVRLLQQCAHELAKIHAIGASALPSGVPVLDPADGVAEFRRQFEETGGDRPVIALGIRWLMDNLPDPVTPVLNHGDYRIGNLLVEDGDLAGVLDWELAHWSDWHEDLAFGCMAVWRFSRIDREALGLGSLEEYFAAYEEAGGRRVDPQRFRFWLVYRTVWWALGCLRMGGQWRSGADRTLERLVISRRTSEQELDLLLLIEDGAPEACKARQDWWPIISPEDERGDGTTEELMVAVHEWLGTLKDEVGGHHKFQLAVARNALGIAIRNEQYLPDLHQNKRLADDILDGKQSLETPGVLGRMRQAILEKITVDMPKYPSLQLALEKWVNPEEDD